MALIEIKKHNQKKPIPTTGTNLIPVPSKVDGPEKFSMQGNHAILALPTGDLSIKVDLKKDPPRVVFAEKGGERLVIPMPHRGSRIEDRVASVIMDDDTIVTVHVPEALRVQLRKRITAFQKQPRPEQYNHQDPTSLRRRLQG